MKAARIDQFSEDFASIKIVDAPMPQPGPGQVLVRMRLSPVNPSDLNFLHGTYYHALERVIWNHGGGVYFDPDRKNPCPTPPYALGGEGVGVVEACGSGLLARRLKGKRVAIAAGPPNGAWQEYVLADAKKAVPMPASISDEQAAMFFVNPLSAYVMIREVLRVPAGAWLLQTAAGSALGKGVVRLSKLFGFRTINVVRSSANTAELLKLGADAVVETDRQDLRSEVHRLTGGKGVAYALDCVGGPTAEAVIRCLALAGRMLVYGTLSKAPMQIPGRDLMMPVAHVSGFFVTNWIAQQSPLKMLGILRNVKRLVADGVFATEISEVLPLEQVHKALQLATAPGRTGKVLLRLE